MGLGKGVAQGINFAASLQRLFYDTAGASGDNSLAPLLGLVDSSRILFGSDYPFMPEAAVTETIRELNSSRLLNAHDLRMIENSNATKLFAQP